MYLLLGVARPRTSRAPGRQRRADRMHAGHERAVGRRARRAPRSPCASCMPHADDDVGGLSVSWTPMCAIGLPSGPIENGTDVHRAPAHRSRRTARRSSLRISAGATQLFVGPASSSRSLQMNVRSSTRATSDGIATRRGSCSERLAGLSRCNMPGSRPSPRKAGRTPAASRRTIRCCCRGRCEAAMSLPRRGASDGVPAVGGRNDEASDDAWIGSVHAAWEWAPRRNRRAGARGKDNSSTSPRSDVSAVRAAESVQATGLPVQAARRRRAGQPLQSTRPGAVTVRRRPAPPLPTAAAQGAHLPMQNRLKITPSRSSALTSPVIVESDCCAPRSSSAKSSSGGGAVSQVRAPPRRGAFRRAHRQQMPLAREETCPSMSLLRAGCRKHGSAKRARRRRRSWPKARLSAPPGPPSFSLRSRRDRSCCERRSARSACGSAPDDR